ncbi:MULTISPECIES: exodeoxyribonuclease VII small subunit [Rhodovulum]|uniref:Exodeoxyribonuclease 7 small subunit n=2 Tax=Rhodovulum TaxID=34008 RepID=A0A8E2VH12_9RHOB|nr:MULTISPECIES: exodeoxyribonuclease VII small subunit [Rhodovulum]PTW43781.1 exodeoxyribonuclease VII small subunit [Rhodovulum kholense]RAP40044.1 exodeoxyribonuclease VII small subunit [Rhodovulum viride]
MTEKPVGEMTFEEAMRALEEAVAALERGDVPLEDSIALSEQAMKLRKHCETKLRDAEAKIEAMTLDASGNPTGTKPAEGL